jgi:hypothetical protein
MIIYKNKQSTLGHAIQPSLFWVHSSLFTFHSKQSFKIK